MGDAARLLLVEFAVIDRFHRATEFPRLQGRARQEGLECRWLRVAVPPDVLHNLGTDGAGLPPEDRAALRDFILGFDPTHILFSRRPAASLVRILDAGESPRRFGYLGGPVDAEAFLGFGGPRNARPPAPDYSWIAGNAAAESLEPLPFVVVGDECRYNKSTAGNPFFRGVDLSGLKRPGGCSFCERPANRKGASEAVLPALERELSAVEKTCPRPKGRRLKIRLSGDPLMRRIDEAAGRILRLGMRPAEFLLDCRADMLLRTSRKFEKALRLLRRTKHRFSLSLIGIENFSSTELQRYNKGVTSSQNLEATRLLFDWEARFPDVFGFREYGGLSLITFNPWTRPEELDLNIAVAELAGIGCVLGKLWTGRLRLSRGLALEAKARQEGLIAEGCGDALLETAKLNFYENEVPWRFQAPEMEAVNRLLTRFALESPSLEDPLSQAVGIFLKEGIDAGLAPTSSAHLVVLAAQRQAWANGKVEPTEVLSAARALLSKCPRALSSGGVDWLRPSSLTEETVKARLAGKPVLKLEPIHPDDLKTWRSLDFLPNVELRRRPWDEAQGVPVWELFCGRDRKEVRRAVALTGLGAAEPSRKNGGKTTAGVGRLLGYPKCCCRAHAADPGPIQERYFWRHVANRIAVSGSVPWEMNPAGQGVEHVPCTLRCAPSLTGARRRLASSRGKGGGDLKNPHLLLWGYEGCWVELRPQASVGERFRYRAGAFSGRGPDVEAVLEGDELALGGETVLVLREGRPYASLSGRAFLWWHKKAFQADFWRELIALRRTVPPPPRSEPRGSELVDSRILALALASVDCEFQSREIDCQSRYDGDVIRLSLAGKNCGLLLAPRSSYRGPFFAELPSFYACIRGETKRTSADDELLKNYLAALARQDGALRAAFKIDAQ